MTIKFIINQIYIQTYFHHDAEKSSQSERFQDLHEITTT